MRRAGVGLVVLVLFSTAWPTTVAGAGGQLDPTFADSGKALVSLDGRAYAVSDIAVQPDDRILVAGYTEPRHGSGTEGSKFIIARFRRDGRVDRSFGRRGYVTTAIREGALPETIGVQPDGKIVVVGFYSVGDGIERLAVVRYQPDGSLDPSFAEGGVLASPLGEGLDVAIQPDGRIVVAGAIDSGAGYVARFQPNGALDPSFSGDGVAEAQEQGDYYALAPLSNGRYAATGPVHSLHYDSLLSVFLENGEPDPSFSDDGFLIDAGPFAGSQRIYVSYSNYDLKLDASGRLLALAFACGSSSWICEPGPVLARYTTEGVLDTSFGEGGYRAIAGSAGFGNGLAVQSDGRALVASYGRRRLILSRIGLDGQLDRSFSGNGLAGVSVAGDYLYPAGIALQAADRLLVAGDAYVRDESKLALLAFKLRGGRKP